MNFVNAGEDYDIFEYQYAIVEAVTWQLDVDKTLEHDSRGPFS